MGSEAGDQVVPRCGQRDPLDPSVGLVLLTIDEAVLDELLDVAAGRPDRQPEALGELVDRDRVGLCDRTNSDFAWENDRSTSISVSRPAFWAPQWMCPMNCSSASSTSVAWMVARMQR